MRCWLLGADSLLVACADELRRRGYEIRGVLTDQPATRQWAEQQKLPVRAPAEVPDEDFELLFSIGYLRKVGAALLSAPSRGAFNFHDGPLPGYAGLNTPVWSILNGESRHGICWHRMEAELDRGAIIARVDFDLEDDETALSLNTRCMEAGLEGFGQLLDRIEAGDVSGEKLPAEGFRLFRAADRPDGAGLLDWSQAATVSARVVRALDHGPGYANPVALAKILLPGGDLAYPAGVLVEEGQGEAGERLPDVDGDWRIATSDGVLRIVAWHGAAPAGARVPVGSRLPQLGAAVRQAWREACEARARNEGELFREPPSTAPLRPREGSPHAAADANGLDALLRLPSGLDASGLLAFFLLRYCGRPEGAVMLRHALPEDLSGLLAEWSPYRLRKAEASTVADLAVRFGGEIAKVADGGPFCADLRFRLPGDVDASRFMAEEYSFGIDATRAAAAELRQAPACVLRVEGEACRLLFDPDRMSADLAADVHRRLADFLEQCSASPGAAPDSLSLLSAQEQAQLDSWGRGDERPWDQSQDALARIRVAAAEAPDLPAVTDRSGTWSYAELLARAESLAAVLRQHGVGTEDRVGIHVERGREMVAAVLAAWMCGAAYLPLDTGLPEPRLRMLLEDGEPQLVISSAPRALGGEVATIAPTASADLPADGLPGTRPENLAYRMYTSGSTGKPKGVEVEHRHLVSFFVAMDERIPVVERRVWLSMTALSFDISILELLWTLTRGFEVVVVGGPSAKKGVDFSVFFWGSGGNAERDAYATMLEACRYVDSRGFHAVWTPERHFHDFGGAYANPSVTSAALAVTTENMRIRSGSVVLPLHHPVRIAEEWAMVDQLSGGRVELGVASGWQPDDFLLRPENHAEAKRKMFEGLEQVRALWRGESQRFDGPKGEVEVRTQPRPVQPELISWIATAGNPDSFRAAGEAGCHLLTHLLGQTVEEVAEKVVVYREAWRAAGHPGDGRVCLMLHSYVGEDDEQARDQVRGPLSAYLAKSIDLTKRNAWAFPTFKKAGKPEQGGDGDLLELEAADVDAIVEHSFRRYFETSGLLGSEQRCLQMIERCQAIGVDEIACLLDFGLDHDTVMEALPRLVDVVERAAAAGSAAPIEGAEVAEWIDQRQVSHFQCTPSRARMLLEDARAAEALGRLDTMLVGGEALPEDLAGRLRDAGPKRLLNMYGPTETTIWSTVADFGCSTGAVTIGRAIANTVTEVRAEDGARVPPGATGELWIGGPGVTRGYANRPERTAAAFVSLPEAKDQRFYRTGDRVRFRDDGLLEFLGRFDSQVKIRGHRLELGEVEVAMSGLPGVLEAAAVLRNGTGGDPVLWGYVRAEQADPDGIRQALRGLLPEAAVPDRILVLDRFPRTPSGKLDRGALPVEVVAPAAAPVEDAQAERPLEKEICAIWAQLLGREDVGLDQNFFDLGGHSLLIVRMQNELRTLLDRRVPLTQLYRHTTVRALARDLSGDDLKKDASVSAGRSRGARRRMLRGRRGSPSGGGENA